MLFCTKLVLFEWSNSPVRLTLLALTCFALSGQTGSVCSQTRTRTLLVFLSPRSRETSSVRGQDLPQLRVHILPRKLQMMLKLQLQLIFSTPPLYNLDVHQLDVVQVIDGAFWVTTPERLSPLWPDSEKLLVLRNERSRRSGRAV